MNKVRKFAFVFSKALLGVIFAVVFTLMLFFSNVSYACKQYFLLSDTLLFLLAVIPFGIFAAVGCIYPPRNSRRHSLTHAKKLSTDNLVYLLCLLLFAAQIYLAFNVF